MQSHCCSGSSPSFAGAEGGRRSWPRPCCPLLLTSLARTFTTIDTALTPPFFPSVSCTGATQEPRRSSCTAAEEELFAADARGFPSKCESVQKLPRASVVDLRHFHRLRATLGESPTTSPSQARRRRPEMVVAVAVKREPLDRDQTASYRFVD